jgi:hypothetical protein
MLRFPRAVVSTGAAAGLVLGGAAPALAGPTDQISPGNDGRNVSVVVVDVKGNGLVHGPGGAADGPGGTRPVSEEVPTPCYWTSGNGAYTGQKFYDSYYQNGKAQNFNVLGLKLPSDEQIAEHKDDEGYWYFVGQTDAGGQFSAEDQAKCDRELQAATGAGYVFVAAGQNPPPLPEAVIPASVLALIARQQIGAPDPGVDRSPGGNSIVGVDTYFWVQDTGDPADGFVALEVTATAGDNTATVVATPEVFTVTLDGRTVECDATQAKTKWRRGLADGSGCTLAPARSSAGQEGQQFEVTAATSYSVAWSGNEDGVDVPGGPLPPDIGGEATFGMQVAEVQAVVTGG